MNLRSPLAFVRARIDRRSKGDIREFLPAVLEVIERPAPPLAMTLLGVICGAVCFTLLWSMIGNLDVVAVGRGKVQPVGRVRLVQAVELGKVQAVHVRDGDRIEEGAIILQLQDDELVADVTAARLALAASRGEAMRCDTIIRSLAAPVAAVLNLPSDIPEDIALREKALFRADLDSITAQLTHIDAQIAQKEAELSRLQRLIAAQQELTAVQRERVDMRDSLLPSGAGTKASAIDAQESLRYQLTILVGYQGELVTAGQFLKVLHAERNKLQSAFVADQSGKLAEASKQVDELRQRVLRGEARLAHMTVRSPAAGFVNGLAVQAAGQVVSAGQDIARIVPEEGKLEIEVYLPNKDIGFVKEGQEVAIKLDAFPFTRYGVIVGHLTRVGRDAIPDVEARQMESEGVARSIDGRAPGGGQRLQNLVFPIIITPAQTHIRVDERDIRLAPGMAVSAEIKTGRRKLIDYFLSPVSSDVGSAFRER